MQITKSTFDGSGRIHLGSAHLNDKKDSDKKVYAKGQVVNVFFDGTMNNYYNANKRPGEDSSYGNDKSNVARMWESIDKQDNQSMSVYIEGIGTKRGQPDSGFAGGGFGRGEYGVAERVYGAFGDIKKKLDQRGIKSQVLTLNVFGFSRGAAAARYFVHLVHSEPQRFDNVGLPRSTTQVRVNFVGLFDCVTKIGAFVSNDVEKFGQRFYSGYANKVFHLRAGDEFRSNFPVTDIQSAKGSCNGYEFMIPGSHSDVGGGYQAGVESETKVLLRGDAFLGFMYEKGWYQPKHKLSDTAWRRNVIGSYQRVGLAIMTDKAEQYSGIQYPASLTSEPNGTHDEPVRALMKILRPIAKGESRSIYKLEDWNGVDRAKWFHEYYLHMSCDQGGVHIVTGDFKRELIAG